MSGYLVRVLALPALALVPGVVTFLRPSWFVRVVAVGGGGAFVLWSWSWFGGTGPGDLGRGGAMILFGPMCVAVLATWVVSATSGRWMRTRRTRRTADHAA